jgi:hypothetical protein
VVLVKARLALVGVMGAVGSEISVTLVGEEVKVPMLRMMALRRERDDGDDEEALQPVASGFLWPSQMRRRFTEHPERRTNIPPPIGNFTSFSFQKGGHGCRVTWHRLRCRQRECV